MKHCERQAVARRFTGGNLELVENAFDYIPLCLWNSHEGIWRYPLQQYV
jgi:hypothetical protein